MGCGHEGTVWRIRLVDSAASESAHGWECTRCGEHWDRDPLTVRPRQSAH